MKKIIITAIICVFMAISTANATTIENWSSSTIRFAGWYYSDMTSEYITVTNPHGFWLINNWKDSCINDPYGPNQCYAPNNNKLYFHGEKGTGSTYSGDGVLFVTKDLINVPNGIIVSGIIRPYCTTTSPEGCFTNIGIYRGEGNYRALGFKNSKMTIWGPTGETNFNGNGYENITITPNQEYHFKVYYWNNSGTWRWDYFLNNTWKAGHVAINDPYGNGPCYFSDNKVRIVLGFGSFIPGTAAETYFGPIDIITW